MPLWTTGRKFTTLQECCSFLHWMAKIPSVCIVLPNTVACGFRNTQTFLKYRADVALYMFQINCGGSEICLRQDFQGAFSFLFYFWSLDKINVSSNRQIFYHCKTVCVLLLLTNFHKYWFLDVLRCLANFMSPLVVQLKTTEQDFFRLVRVNRS